MSQDNLGQIKENLSFLQSEEWRKFQEATGKRTYSITGDYFSASIIKHQLPIVGSYLYIPRDPVMPISNFQFPISNHRQGGVPRRDKIPNPNDQINKFFSELISLAKKEKAGWIRFDLESEEILDLIIKSTNYKIAKAPHDMQPREILVIDITKPEEELLAEMKPKTRYNINLSRKRGVSVKVISNFQFPISNQIQNPNDKDSKYYIDKFIELVELTAKRKGIKFHPGDYYRKMIESIPGDILRLYIAEYNNKVIAANLVVFYKNTAIYLHGATDDEYRNMMAPYLLQWQAIKDAKKAGCEKYDLGGIKTYSMEHRTWNKDSWKGITKFKLGFSPNTKPIEFPGSYDIIINSFKYWLYKNLQLVKSFLR